MNDVSQKFKSPLFSFPSNKPDRKIDFIFVSPDIEVLEADIPAIVASDHRPTPPLLRFERDKIKILIETKSRSS